MKKTVIIIIVIALIALFPITLRQKDGGTVVYTPITFVYRVTSYNRFSEEGTLKGKEIRIFGIKVYSNTYVEADSDGR